MELISMLFRALNKRLCIVLLAATLTHIGHGVLFEKGPVATEGLMGISGKNCSSSSFVLLAQASEDTEGVLKPITKFASATKDFLGDKLLSQLSTIKHSKPLTKALLTMNSPTTSKREVMEKLDGIGAGFVQYINTIERLESPGQMALLQSLIVNKDASAAFGSFANAAQFTNPSNAFLRLKIFEERFSQILKPFMHSRNMPLPVADLQVSTDSKAAAELFDSFSAELIQHIAYVVRIMTTTNTEPMKLYMRKMFPRLKFVMRLAWDVLDTGIVPGETIHNKRVISSIVNHIANIDSGCQDVIATAMPLLQQYFPPLSVDTYYSTPQLSLYELQSIQEGMLNM